jgi:nucleoid-associated protein YgaU
MHDYMLDNRVIKMKVQEAEQDVVVNIRKQDRIRRQDVHHKKLINMLSSLSAVLFLVCLLMGIGLIQNGDRISRLESQLKNIDGAYKNVVAQIKADKAQPVFAAQTPEQYPTTEIIDKVDQQPIIAQVSKEAQEAQQTSSQPVEEVVLIDESIALSLEEEVEEIEEATVIVNESSDSPKPEPSAPVVKEQKPVASEVDIPTQYTVAAGDSLNYISYKIYGTTGLVAKIMEANEIDNPNKIYEGKVLKLPRP